jgi:hypothetical protein
MQWSKYKKDKKTNSDHQNRKLKIEQHEPNLQRSERTCYGREAVPAPHVAPIVINIMMGHKINMSSIIPYDVKRQLLTLHTLTLRMQRRSR